MPNDTFIDVIIHSLANAAGAMECRQKEAENPRPDLSQEKDPVKRAIKEMLTENTGCSILDSGGAYGRHWEKNRHRDFDSEPTVIVEVWDNEVTIMYDVYHYLINFLELDEECKKLQKRLDKFTSREDSHYLQDMEDFMKAMKDEGYSSRGITNTYNYDNLISQILQYGVIQNEDTGQDYIILQTHNGCDARGGYSKPRIFSLGMDSEYMFLAQSDVNASCNRCKMSWWSDDCGYHFYDDGINDYQQDNLNAVNNTKPDTEFKVTYDKENQKVCHKGCGGEISFWVTESY